MCFCCHLLSTSYKTCLSFACSWRHGDETIHKRIGLWRNAVPVQMTDPGFFLCTFPQFFNFILRLWLNGSRVLVRCFTSNGLKNQEISGTPPPHNLYKEGRQPQWSHAKAVPRTGFRLNLGVVVAAEPDMLPPSGPDWMSELPEQLWDVALTDLAIPGTSLEPGAWRRRSGTRRCCCYDWHCSVLLSVYWLAGVQTFSLRACFDPLEVLQVNLRDKDVKIKSQ